MLTLGCQPAPRLCLLPCCCYFRHIPSTSITRAQSFGHQQKSKPGRWAGPLLPFMLGCISLFWGAAVLALYRCYSLIFVQHTDTPFGFSEWHPRYALCVSPCAEGSPRLMWTTPSPCAALLGRFARFLTGLGFNFTMDVGAEEFSGGSSPGQPPGPPCPLEGFTLQLVKPTAQVYCMAASAGDVGVICDIAFADSSSTWNALWGSRCQTQPTLTSAWPALTVDALGCKWPGRRRCSDSNNGNSLAATFSLLLSSSSFPAMGHYQLC